MHIEEGRGYGLPTICMHACLTVAVRPLTMDGRNTKLYRHTSIYSNLLLTEEGMADGQPLRPLFSTTGRCRPENIFFLLTYYFCCFFLSQHIARWLVFYLLSSSSR